MKNSLLLVFAFFLSFHLTAQSCGGVSACTPSAATGNPGIFPESNQVNCVVRNSPYITLLTIEIDPLFSGQTVNFFRFDSILNLPAGLCWKSNKSNNQYVGGETGCIEISGTSAAPAGLYKLKIKVTANVGSGAGLPLSGDWETLTGATGVTPFRLYLRVIDAGSNCPCVDTVAGASNYFVAYNGSETACPVSGSCNSFFTYTQQCDTFHFQASASAATYLWDFGDNTTSTLSAPSHIFTQNGTRNVSLTVSGTGCNTTHTVSVSPWDCLASDTICGVFFNDNNGNGIRDASETGIAGQHVISGGLSAISDANGNYLLPISAGNYTVRYAVPSTAAVTVPVNGSGAWAEYQVPVSGGGRHCGFDFGVNSTYRNIAGTVYFDNNHNGTLDAGEPSLPYAEIHIGNTSVWTNEQGVYSSVIPANTYSVSYDLSMWFSGFTVMPSVYNITPADTNLQQLNFGIQAPQGFCDAAVMLVPTAGVVAGQPTGYNIRVFNFGAAPTSGSVTFTYDSVVHFISAQPAPTAHNAALHQLTFHFDSIPGGGMNTIEVLALADSILGVNVLTTSAVSVTSNCNDTITWDNTDTLMRLTFSSFDPNEKEVFPHGRGQEGFIPKTEQLKYVVHFQNTGNSPAINIVVRDTLSPNLDMNSLRVVGASHPFVAQQADRVLQVRFSGIMLADSFSNEKESHGWVAFTVKPKSNLSSGTAITNQAAIYFDYNEAVFTNRVLNTIEFPLGIADNENQVHVVLMPNPFDAFTTLKISGGEAVESMLYVYDLCGREVLRQTVGSGTSIRMERQQLSAGTYVYELRQKGVAVAKGRMFAK